MKTKILTTAVMTIATVAVAFGCASKRSNGDAQARADAQDVNKPAGTVGVPDPMLDAAPAQVADVDTATKYDLANPSDRNANLGASSSGRSR